MNALHQAVARAIADELAGCKCLTPVRATSERAADAAIRVVLADAQRNIEQALCYDDEGKRDAALAVLTALGDEA